ncbi:MAG: hypothetical protein ACLR13_06045 [Acutalibacteraceae bacterium]
MKHGQRKYGYESMQEGQFMVQEMQNRANQQLRGTPSFAASPRTNRSNNESSFQVELTEIILKSPLTTHQMNKYLYMGTTEVVCQAPLRSADTEHCGKFIRRSYERQRTNFNHDTAAGTV